MGLHNTAHFIKSKGRGDDTELVHMTKGEVQALKGLAAKHGGNLTTNPETGLPEAGFLSNILPTVAGVAVGVMTENPMLGAAVAGGLGYAESGSITKGLMAGISAYGFEGLGSSLASLGEEAATTGADIGAATTDIAPETLKTTQAAYDTTTAAEDSAGYSGELNQVPGTAPYSPTPSSVGSSPAWQQGLSNMGAGLKVAAQAPGAFLSSNLGNIGMASAPFLADALTKRPTLPGASTAQQTNPMGMKTIPTDSSGHPIFNATLPSQPSPAYHAQYANYVQNPYDPYSTTPTPRTTVYAADGGLMQDGSANVDFMGTGAYPMSQQDTPHYATPSQMPTSAQAAMASYEPNTNPLTGEQTSFASGGIASYSGKYGSVVDIQNATDAIENLSSPRPAMSTPHADPGIYQDTDPNTRNLDAYSAALYKLNAKAKSAQMGKNAIVVPKPAVQLGQIDTEDNAQGGIVGMAAGGDTSSRIYRPTYTNYQQTPYVQKTPAQLLAATQAYDPTNIPVPTRTATGIASAPNAPQAPGSTGYAINPAGMIGSPAYNALQQQLADAQAAQKAAQDQLNAQQSLSSMQNYGANSNGATGGLPKDFKHHYAIGGFVPSLGSYAAGGNPRLLKGPGDGMSDSIPANIGGKQPARLADGEFVVPADVVSHLGNGSTDAGAKKLYSMMDNIRKARTGRKKQAPAVKPEKYLPK
jgi:hypothetical protein